MVELQCLAFFYEILQEITSFKPYTFQLLTIVHLRLVRTDSVKTFPGDLSVHAGRGIPANYVKSVRGATILSINSSNPVI